MEINRVSSGFVDLDRTIGSLMVETALTAQKTLALLLLMIGSLLKDIDLSDVLGAEKRFPFGDLSRVAGPAAENMDAGESEDDDDDEDNENDDDDSDDDDDDEDSSGEDGSDGNGDPDDDSDANGNGGSDDDDDDDDSDEDDDESDEDNDDDDDNQPPFKKKK